MNNIFPCDVRNELLDTDRKVTPNQPKIKCPLINVQINESKIKMLIDTGSQLTVLSNKWVQQNKKYFKHTAVRRGCYPKAKKVKSRRLK